VEGVWKNVVKPTLGLITKEEKEEALYYTSKLYLFLPQLDSSLRAIAAITKPLHFLLSHASSKTEFSFIFLMY